MLPEVDRKAIAIFRDKIKLRFNEYKSKEHPFMCIYLSNIDKPYLVFGNTKDFPETQQWRKTKFRKIGVLNFTKDTDKQIDELLAVEPPNPPAPTPMPAPPTPEPPKPPAPMPEPPKPPAPTPEPPAPTPEPPKPKSAPKSPPKPKPS